jgi:hypothetical protein
MNRTVSLSEAIALQHVQQSSLSGVVETEENDVGGFLEKSHPFESGFKEIVDKHFYN